MGSDCLPLQKPDLREIIRLADSLLLSLDDAQLELLDKEFGSVVAQFERLLIIDTDGVEPTDFITFPGSTHAMRLDAVDDRVFSRDDMARNTASLMLSGLLSINKA